MILRAGPFGAHLCGTPAVNDDHPVIVGEGGDAACQVPASSHRGRALSGNRRATYFRISVAPGGSAVRACTQARICPDKACSPRCRLSGGPKGLTLVHKDSPGDEPDRGLAGFPTGSDEAGNEASETRGGRWVPCASA